VYWVDPVSRYPRGFINRSRYSSIHSNIYFYSHLRRTCPSGGCCCLSFALASAVLGPMPNNWTKSLMVCPSPNAASAKPVIVSQIIIAGHGQKYPEHTNFDILQLQHPARNIQMTAHLVVLKFAHRSSIVLLTTSLFTNTSLSWPRRCTRS